MGQHIKSLSCCDNSTGVGSVLTASITGVAECADVSACPVEEAEVFVTTCESEALLLPLKKLRTSRPLGSLKPPPTLEGVASFAGAATGDAVGIFSTFFSWGF